MRFQRRLDKLISALEVTVEYPLSEMLGARSLSDFFKILEYLHTHKEIYRTWGSGLKMMFLFLMHIA